MLNVSDIPEFIYCPAKFYLKYKEGSKIQTISMIKGKIIHEIRRSFEDTIKHNLWNVNKNMGIGEIQNTILWGVPEFIEKLHNGYLDSYEIDEAELNNFFRELEEDLIIEASVQVLRIKKLMETTKKDGMEISKLLFPQSLFDFSLENKELNLRGRIDKIEVINGIYYPVEIKTGYPPVKGTWLSHALQIAAYALLIDYELNKEVLVGFVDYTRIFERRTVVVNSILHNKFFEVLDAINKMLERNEIPEFNLNKKKCEKCEYIEICNFYG